MTRIESELHDLYECLMRNDGMADRDTYRNIVGIANDVAEVEAENANLRELAADAWRLVMKHAAVHPSDLPKVDAMRDRISELGIEVTGK